MVWQREKRMKALPTGVVFLHTDHAGAAQVAEAFGRAGVHMGDQLAADTWEDVALGAALGAAAPSGERQVELELEHYMSKVSKRHSRWGIKCSALAGGARLVERVQSEHADEYRVKYLWVRRSLESCVRLLVHCGVEKNYSAAVARINSQYGSARSDYETLPKDRKMVVAFEDLQESPHMVFREVAHWYGITDGREIARGAAAIKTPGDDDDKV